MAIESRFWVRVLLLSRATECTIAAPSGLRIAPGGMALKTSVSPTKLGIVAGRFLLGTTALPGTEVLLSPDTPYIFELNGQQYRGRLKLIANEDGQSFDAINLVPLEPYLAGVVGKEMPDDWEPQALRAQAIVARTYCLFSKIRFGPNRSYDVKRTQASQVYGGVAAESERVWNAVNETCGQILTAPEPASGARSTADYGSSPADGNRAAGPPSQDHQSPFPGLFPAYYSSACGGHTTNSKEVFGDSYGPLRGVPCPYCKDVAALSLFYWPMATFDRATVTQKLVRKYPKLAALGEIAGLEVLAQSNYGDYSRLTRIRLTGAGGKTDTLRAEDLRLTLDPSGCEIRSMICRVIPWGSGWAFASGRGWGHGVGMCQHGAQGMARRGNNARSILQYYYPGAEIVNVY